MPHLQDSPLNVDGTIKLVGSIPKTTRHQVTLSKASFTFFGLALMALATDGLSESSESDSAVVFFFFDSSFVAGENDPCSEARMLYDVMTTSARSNTEGSG